MSKINKSKVKLLEDFTKTYQLINSMPIRLGRYDNNNRITETLVRQMMVDIEYLIFFGNFNNGINLDIRSVGMIAAILRSFYVQKVDMWHAIYLLNDFNLKSELPMEYKENHTEIYYKLGASQRKTSDMEELLMVVEINCCY